MIPIKSVISQSTPLSLVNIVPCFIAKSSSLTKIIRKLELLNLKPCIYGSFSWQIITKKNYTHADSDLDILLHVSMHHQLKQIVLLLNALAVASGRRIDGELIFPDGYAVAWREWFSDSDRILCKGFRGVKFIHRNALLEQLA